MLRIDRIYVKIDEGSRLTSSKVQQTLEDQLRKAASATRFKVVQKEMGFEVILEESISLQTANKILNAFDKERMIIKNLAWERKLIGPFRQGYLAIIVS